jgi:hypothetical protein
VGAGNSKEPVIQSTNSGRVASNPGYSFNGDLDTGMFNPNLDNTIAFATGATERMRIDSSGKVGIGTSSPGATLDVQNTTGTSSIANFGGSSQTSYSKVDFRTDTINATQAFHIAYGSANPENLNFAMKNTSGDLFFVSSGIETMRMKSGKVGIGTSSPRAKLEVVGDIISGLDVYTYAKFEGGQSGNLTIRANAGNANISSANIIFSNSTSGGNQAERMRISSSGNVGIGTSSPDNPLTVKGAIKTIDNFNSNGNRLMTVLGIAGVITMVQLDIDLNGAGGYWYKVAMGGTGVSSMQEGAGYTNGTANFSHDLLTGSSWTVSMPSDNLLRLKWTGSNNIHPVVTLDIAKALDVTLNEDDITATWS